MAYLRRGFLKAAHRPNDLYCRIDSITLAVFAFIMLLIFMTAQPMVTPGFSVDLPASFRGRPVPAAVKWDAIRISVTREGSIYFRKAKVAADDLPNRIHDAVLNGAEKKIYFEVDARALYRDVKVVLPQIQLAGVEKICFLTY